MRERKRRWGGHLKNLGVCHLISMNSKIHQHFCYNDVKERAGNEGFNSATIIKLVM
jgi:hypothetical protein